MTSGGEDETLALTHSPLAIVEKVSERRAQADNWSLDARLEGRA